MSVSPYQNANELDPNLIELTAAVCAHQRMYEALLVLMQRPLDDQALARLLQARQNLVTDVARAELRMAART